MAKKDVDQEKVRISTAPAPESSLKRLDEVFILVTQAFCPNGHNLVNDDNALFDGYPGIKLELRSPEKRGIVYLSPFHGDESKRGDVTWEVGQALDVRCPECAAALPKIANCNCGINPGTRGDLVKLFLSRSLNDSHILALCNVWGCRRSRTIDNWNIISEFLDGQISD
jgi:hypothetical protein